MKVVENMKMEKSIVSRIALIVIYIYVGFTTQALSKRMDAHRSACKDATKCNARLYQKMNQIGIDNFYISLLEKYPCSDIEELRARKVNGKKK